MDIEDFLNYAATRLANDDDPLPCEAEDYGAVLAYLMALRPEYQLTLTDDAASREARRAERRRGVLDGLRRARGASPAPVPNGGAAGNGTGNGDAGRSPSGEAA